MTSYPYNNNNDSSWGFDSSHSVTSDNDDQGAPEALVRSENRLVFFARAFVGVVISVSAIASSVLLYFFSSNVEQAAYQTAFDAVATRVVDGLVVDTSLKFYMAKTIATTVKNSMQLTGSSALSLTIDESIWDEATQEARFVGQVLFVSLNPMIRSDEDRVAFENFTQPQNFRNGPFPECEICGVGQYYPAEGFAYFPGYSPVACNTVDIAARTGAVAVPLCGPTRAVSLQTCTCAPIPDDVELPTSEVVKPGYIFQENNQGEEEMVPYEKPLYHPFWQTAILNAIQPPMMYDHLSSPILSEAISKMDQHKIPVMTKIYKREGLLYEKFGGSVGDFSAMIYFPITDSNGTVVASVSMEILFTTYSISVFPKDADKVQLVVENTWYVFANKELRTTLIRHHQLIHLVRPHTNCIINSGQNYTFSLDPQTNRLGFLGDTDLASAGAGEFAKSSSFDNFEFVISATGGVQEFADFDFCRYRFHVFTTKAFAEEFLTVRPKVLASGCFSIFLFTAIVFMLYDVAVRRRQAKIMTSAKQTNDLVSSLFPAEVRDRLIGRPSKSIMESFASNGVGAADMSSAQPIADTFAAVVRCCLLPAIGQIAGR
jgi:hypothetical protein